MNIQKNVASCFLVFLLLFLLNKQNAAVGPCVYGVDPLSIIDLTSVGRSDGTPTWKKIVPSVSDGHVYSYNPCYPFSQSTCRDVAACLTFATDESLADSLGSQNSIQWNKVSGQDLPTLTYSSGDKILHVNLICLNPGEYDTLQVYGFDSTTNSHIMTLSSMCACYNGCKDRPSPGPDPGHHPKPSDGLSPGAIIIIILVVLLVVYLVIFMAFNKFQRQATGIEILPHRTFWVSLPGYSLDGAKFIFRKTTGKSGYNTV